MIPVTTMAGRTVAVFGLARSGRAACEALAAGGAHPAAWDDNAAAREAAAAAGLPVVDLNAADWSGFAALVLAPGVPLTHPRPHWTVEKARGAGVPVIGDVELFARERAAHAPGSPFIAITGTNGKSTTTALVAHVLRSAGRDVQMGGNIGVPILELAPPAQDRIHVIELSSYQIDLMPTLHPTIGMFLNISPDHLDRHGPADDPAAAMRNYLAIKQRVVAGADTALVSVDEETTAALAQTYLDAAGAIGGFGPVCIPVSTTAPVEAGIFCAGTAIDWHATPRLAAERLADVAGIPTLRGRHNLQNAAFAAAAARSLGLAPADIQAAFETFPGLAHRMENVGRLGSVLFINDSKATNADSADKALGSFDDAIYWVAGGRQKEGGIAPLASHFKRLAKAYLIGECAEDFAATLAGRVPFEVSGTLDEAVAAAARDAARSSAPEPVVLLSPACASFDQFASFEARGDAFRQSVSRLPGIEMQARAQA